MKKLLAGIILATAIFGGAAGAHTGHQPSQYCKDHANMPAQGTTSPNTKSEVATDNVLVDVDGHTSAVCITSGPAKGAVVVHHLKGNEGWVLVDGDSTNPAQASGYLAVQASDNTDHSGVAGACSGNYDHDRTNTPTPGIADPTTCAP